MSFRWNGTEYRVAEVPATWHLRDRWWSHPAESDFHKAESDLTFCRVRCPEEQVLDLFHDAVSGLWVLDRAHD